MEHPSSVLAELAGLNLWLQGHGNVLALPLSPGVGFLALGWILFTRHLDLGVTGAPLFLGIHLEDVGNVRGVAAEPGDAF